jgi:HlyD family secretion protein
MDTELPNEVKIRRRVKNAILWSAGAAFTLLIIYGFYSFIKPSVKKSSLLTAVAETGSIEATISASGLVVPMYEQIITSPVEAKIEKVFHYSGETVNPGDPILLLNKEYSLIALDKLKEEQALKKNKIVQEKITLERSINDLESKYEIQVLKVESLQALYEDEKKLKEIGGTTEDKLKQAHLNLQVAEKELDLIKKQISNLQNSNIADLKALDHEIRIQQKSIEELERKIEQAEVKVTNKGVVTWVNGDIGTNINPGDQVAKVADLSSFKIEGTISDVYAGLLNIGSRVIVKVQNLELRGTINKIQPSVANGIVSFSVELDQKDHVALRPNLRVDVYVVTAFKDNVVRVKNGPFYKGSRDQKIFIINEKKAIRKTVNIGESNFEYVEIINEVQPGDQVIISDMSDYIHMEQVLIEN